MSFMNGVSGKMTYTPINKNKYKGKGLIQCRSKWEHDFCRFCDYNENVIAWASEPLQIPYFDVITNKKRQYFPDFLIKVINKDGDPVTWLVEVKPYKEINQPKPRKTKNKERLLQEKKTWYTNLSKWKAASVYCKKKGWNFKLITEKELYGKNVNN